MMKYIQFDYAGFVVFERAQKHSAIAKKFPHDTVLSAGFVDMALGDKEDVSCQGESMSLNVKSKPIDSQRLWRKISIYSY